jgi:hypothetical protein
MIASWKDLMDQKAFYVLLDIYLLEASGDKKGILKFCSGEEYRH